MHRIGDDRQPTDAQQRVPLGIRGRRRDFPERIGGKDRLQVCIALAQHGANIDGLISLDQPQVTTPAVSNVANFIGCPLSTCRDAHRSRASSSVIILPKDGSSSATPKT